MKYSRMIRVQSIKVRSVYTVHTAEDKLADPPRYCNDKIISVIFFFHFTWAKSNEVTVLNDSLSATAHNFSARGKR